MTDKRGPLIRSPPGSWSEPNRKIKMGRKETLVYKRSLDSGSGGPERKGKKHQGEKRQLTLSSNNELQCSRKRYRGDEIVMPSTSGYNLRPRRGAKVKSRPTNEKRTHYGVPVRARRSWEHLYSPYIEGQAAGIPEAGVISNSIARRGKRSEQQQIHLPGGPSRRHQLQLALIIKEKGTRGRRPYNFSIKWIDKLKSFYQLQTFTDIFDQFINPFDTEVPKDLLINTSSGKAASEAVEKFLFNIKEYGEIKRKTFIADCEQGGRSIPKMVKRVKPFYPGMARVELILTSHCSATRGLLATDHVILNHGQVTWTTPELAPPLNYHTTPTGGRFSSRQI
ncbi:uncharacterized protein TNCV_3328751 [Trichonephila clavipes]|nr:uncharacterized protein TNCV_3328751 [Trichonephila clavipes]